MNNSIINGYIKYVSENAPQAEAHIRGSEFYPNIKGYMNFYALKNCVLITAYIKGLPTSDNLCRQPVFGFHIHEGEACTGDSSDSFADVKGHYNPYNCPHPYHAGDLPPLFGVYGEAWASFVTSRINVGDIIGRTVIIHEMPDDFTSQPSGNSGKKIACGIIRKYS